MKKLEPARFKLCALCGGPILTASIFDHICTQCPKCGGNSIARVAYGEPTYEFEQRVAKGDLKGTVVLGGCCVWNNCPTLQCNSCTHQWRPCADEAPSQSVGEKLARPNER